MADKKMPEIKQIYTLDFQYKSIENLHKVLLDLDKQQSLNNTNMNTFNSLLNSVAGLKSRLSTIRTLTDGEVDVKTVKEINEAYEKIERTIGTVISSEKNMGITVEEYTQKLENARKKLEDIQKQIDKNKNSITGFTKNAKGAYKENEPEIRESAARTLRGSRKGADTKVEKMLKESTLKNIKVKSEEGDETAKKALAAYNKELEVLKKNKDDLLSKNEELKQQRDEAKKQLKEITEGYKGYNTSVVNQLEQHKEATKDFADSNEYLYKQAETTGAATVNLNTKIKDTSSTINKAAKAVINYSLVYRTLMNMFKQAINTVVEMDQALTGMSIVTGRSREKLQEMIPTLNNLAQATGQTVTDVANLTTEYLRQGRTMNDAIELAEQTARAASIAGISTAESINYMTAAINGFNLEASQASHVSDVFAKLAASSAVDYEGLAVSLSKVAAQANTAGMSIEYTAAILAKGIETTQEAPESIGTALKTVLARMREMSDYGSALEDNTDINAVESALKAAGVQLRNTAGEFRNLEDVFNDLGPKWEGLNTMQQQAIAQAVAGTRQQARFLAIMQDWDRTIELTNTALDAEGASLYQSSQYMKGMEAALTNLTTAWQGFVQNLVNNDAIIFMVEKVTSLFNFINKISSLMGDIPSMTAGLTLVYSLIMRFINEAKLRREEERNLVAQIAERMGVVSTKQNELNNKLKEELTLRERISDAIRDKAIILEEERKKSSSIAVNAFNSLKGLISSIKNRRKQFKLLKEEAKLQTSNKKEQRKYAKEKLNQNKKEIKDGVKSLKTIKKQTGSRKEMLQAAQENVETAKKEEEVAKSNLDIANQNVSEKENALVADANALKSLKKEAKTEEDLQAISELQKGVDERRTELNDAITTQKSAQKSLDEAKLNTSKQQVIANKAEHGGLIRNTGELLKQFALSVGKALTNFATMALAGLAIGAVTSIAGNIIGSIKSLTPSGGSKKRTEKISKNQNEIYENKEKRSSLQSLRDEYSELLLKQNAGTIDTEGRERMREIIVELQDIDKNITGSGDALLNSIDNAIEKIDKDNEKLIKSNYKLLLKNANQSSKQASKNLGKEVNQLAIRQYFGLMSQQEYENDPLLEDITTIQDDLIRSIDWAQFGKELGKRSDNVIESLNESTRDFAFEMASIGKDDKNALSQQVDIYNKYLGILKSQSAGTDEVVNALQAQYKSLSILSDKTTAVSSLENAGVASSSILKLVSSLDSLGLSSANIGKVIDGVVEEMDNNLMYTEALMKKSKDLIPYLLDTSKESRIKFAKEYGFNEEEYAKMSEPAFRKVINSMFDTVTDLGSNGWGASNTSSKRTASVSRADTIQELQANIRDGGLTQENQEWLKTNFADLYANPAFQKALIQNTAEAAAMLQEAADVNRNKDIVDITNAMTSYQNIVDEQIKKLGITTNEYWAMSSEERARRFTGKDNEELLETINQTAAQVQYYKDTLKAVKEAKFTAEEIDAYTNAIDRFDAQIDALNNDIEKNGATVEKYANLVEIYTSGFQTSTVKMNDILGKFANIMGTNIDGIKEYYSIQDGKLIPNAKKINNLTDEQRQTWLDIEEELSEVVEKNYEYKEAIEEANKALLESAADTQDEILDAYKTRLENELEELQNNLDKRREMYDKYFQALEDAENRDTYIEDREVLMNKIAKLSTATDSTSLSALKEAQSQLKDLDKEYNTSLRERRKEAIDELLDKESETAEERTNELLENSYELWKQIQNNINDPAWVKELMKEGGYFDGGPIRAYLAELEYKGLAATIDSLANYGFNPEQMLDALKVTTGSYSNQNNNILNEGNSSDTKTTTNFSVGNITINADNLTKDEVENLVKESMDDMWGEIAKQFGVNVNTNTF